MAANFQATEQNTIPLPSYVWDICDSKNICVCYVQPVCVLHGSRECPSYRPRCGHCHAAWQPCRLSAWLAWASMRSVPLSQMSHCSCSPLTLVTYPVLLGFFFFFFALCWLTFFLHKRIEREALYYHRKWKTSSTCQRRKTYVYTCIHVCACMCVHTTKLSSSSSGILLPSSPSLALNRRLASVRAMVRKGYRKTEIFSRK